MKEVYDLHAAWGVTKTVIVAQAETLLRHREQCGASCKHSDELFVDLAGLLVAEKRAHDALRAQLDLEKQR